MEQAAKKRTLRRQALAYPRQLGDSDDTCVVDAMWTALRRLDEDLYDSFFEGLLNLITEFANRECATAATFSRVLCLTSSLSYFAMQIGSKRVAMS